MPASTDVLQNTLLDKRRIKRDETRGSQITANKRMRTDKGLSLMSKCDSLLVELSADTFHIIY